MSDHLDEPGGLATDRSVDTETHAERPATPVESASASRPFGIVDVVEAFTAMRHEWRNSSTETRQLVTQIDEVCERLMSASKLKPNGPADAKSNGCGLALSIAEIEHATQRAVEAAAAATSRFAEDLEEELDAQFRMKNVIVRWVTAGTYRQVIRTLRDRGDCPSTQNILAGFELLLTRIRRLMADASIDRIETLGEPFDAHWMHAIAAAPGTGLPNGQVIEQLKPAYRWQGERLAYAEVRIAQD